MGQHEIFGVQDEGKTAGLCSYFFVLGWSVSFFGYHKLEKTSLSSFHLRQTLFLYLSYIAVRYGIVPILSATGVLGGIFSPFNVIALVNVTFVAFWLVGLIGASKGQQKAIPLLGRAAQVVFAAI